MEENKNKVEVKSNEKDHVEQIQKQEGAIQEKYIFDYKVVISYIIATIFMGMGMYKLFFYKNSEYYIEGNVNAYVGGDAYNYIINGNFATAYFVLSLIFVVFGSAFYIVNSLLYRKDSSK